MPGQGGPGPHDEAKISCYAGSNSTVSRVFPVCNGFLYAAASETRNYRLDSGNWPLKIKILWNRPFIRTISF